MGGLLSRTIPFEDLSEDDIIIVLIGPSGSGKSTFINTAAGIAGGKLLKVGKGLEPCTREITYVRCDLGIGQRPIVFVDTPAFPNPDERMRDAEKALEKRIVDWQKRAFGKTIQVSGILYLYNSTDNRMTQPPAVHFNVFKNLCGNDFQGRILLVMTMWERVKPDVRETRKKALTRNWGYLALVVQHLGTQESAWDIVQNLLDNYGHIPRITTRDTTRDAAKNLSSGLNTVYDSVLRIGTSLFSTSAGAGPGAAIHQDLREILDKRENSLALLMQSRTSESEVAANSALTTLRKDMENVLREDISYMHTLQTLLHSPETASTWSVLVVNPTSRLETVKEVRDATAITPLKSSSDMVSHDDGRKHRGNNSEREPVPKEVTDMPAEGTTKTMSEEPVVNQVKDLNNSGEGTREACQRTDGSPRIGEERSSGDDSEQILGDGDPDLRKPFPDGQTGGVVSPPPPLEDSAIPMQRPDMSYFVWSPYHPGYMNGPVMWVPPQAPPVHHFHINIHNSNINNQVAEDPEDDADDGDGEGPSDYQDHTYNGSESKDPIWVLTRRRSAHV